MGFASGQARIAGWPASTLHGSYMTQAHHTLEEETNNLSSKHETSTLKGEKFMLTILHPVHLIGGSGAVESGNTTATSTPSS